MTSNRLMRLALGLAFTLVASACAASPSSTTTPPGTQASVKAQLFVFSNSSPHVTVIDAETRKVVRTADIPGFTSWTWNDDNNYFDGKDLWLGTLNQDTDDAVIITLNLDTLKVTHRMPIGRENLTTYISKASRTGVLHVAKMGAHQIVAIDTKAFQVKSTFDVPVNGGVVCDIDVHAGRDGIERVYYPTWKCDTVVAMNPTAGELLNTAEFPKGTGPWMSTRAPDGRLWVQEGDANSNAVLDGTSLALVKRFPTGKSPTNVTFSPDGKFAYITYLQDTIVTVVDAKSLTEVARVLVGTNPWQVGVHPNGKAIYAILTKEASIAAIDTGSWTVTERIALGTNPTGIFVHAIS